MVSLILLCFLPLLSNKIYGKMRMVSLILLRFLPLLTKKIYGETKMVRPDSTLLFAPPQ